MFRLNSEQNYLLGKQGGAGKICRIYVENLFRVLFARHPPSFLHKLTFFPQFRFAFLDGGNEHVTDTSSGQAVKTTLHAINGNDVQVLGT